MKTKKFKLERKALEDAKKALYSCSLRAKLLSAHVAENYVCESFYNILLVKYQECISKYHIEVESLLEDGKNIFIVSQEQVEKLNYHKNMLNLLEDSINASGVFSLKVH